MSIFKKLLINYYDINSPQLLTRSTMQNNDPKNIDTLLDTSEVKNMTFEIRINHFKRIADLLGFKKIEIESCDTRKPNEKIKYLDFGKGTKKSISGVYFFHVTNNTKLEYDDWITFKGNSTVSPWTDKNRSINATNILYIGQRHEDLQKRLEDHTVKVSNGTGAMRLFNPQCPPFNYSITVYYLNTETGNKTKNKIYCLLLESVAKDLFPTLIGK